MRQAWRWDGYTIGTLSRGTYSARPACLCRNHVLPAAVAKHNLFFEREKVMLVGGRLLAAQYWWESNIAASQLAYIIPAIF